MSACPSLQPRVGMTVLSAVVLGMLLLPGPVAAQVGPCPTAASWSNFGAGHPGTLGVPTLSLSADPVLGSTVTMDIGSSLGLHALTCVMIGSEQASLSGIGGTVLVDPFHPLTGTFELQVSPLGESVPFTILPAWCGDERSAQAIIYDPGASMGFSLTPGLVATFGS